MRLSVPDKNEFLKAAVKATDLESLKRWLVSVVDTVDALPEGKADVPVPPYVPPTAGAVRPGDRTYANTPAWHDGTLGFPAENGAR